MTITEAHKIVAEAGGEMALAIVRKEADRTTVENWSRRLRIVAEGLEQRARELPK